MIPKLDTEYTQYAPVTLHVEPQALPAVRAAFEKAIDRLFPHLTTMKREALITQDWMGDDGSAALRMFYNQWVMASPDGPFSALVKYQNQLMQIRDQLRATEAEYRRVEGENSDLWGRA